ncbi:AMP-binding protein [Streptomyces cavernae]|uniref:AMP-binding protein n=1 Tax=Streptomyces cavernae TaxID=2259034 RepID=UPI00192E40FE|nr:AMP-binding protein [Streptomyces cavernae]
MTNATAALREARDHLLHVRTAYDEVATSFHWPDVGPAFNFAFDWFDAIARGNQRPALVLAEEHGSTASYTLHDMAYRSDKVAVYLAAQGVRRGDSVVVMLGNQVELRESMLALIRLGAVIMPTTTAVGTSTSSIALKQLGSRGHLQSGRWAQVRGRPWRLSPVRCRGQGSAGRLAPLCRRPRHGL